MQARVNQCAFIDEEHARRIRWRVQQLLTELPESVLTAIGGTRMVRLSRVNPTPSVAIYAKLEGQNPSGSIKDRMTLYMIADAIESGKITKDTVLLEASSGNTGISLAMLGAVLGYRVHVTMADNVSAERVKLIRAYGAHVEHTPGAKGTNGAIARARELASQSGYFWIAQHYNPVNSFAHYETTGVEIVEQTKALGISKLDAVVIASGTTGTLMGVSTRVRETFPNVEIISVWPKNPVMGIRRPDDENPPSIYDAALIDRVIEVTNADCMAMVDRVARREGMLLGPSGGAAILGAISAASDVHAARDTGTVLTLIADFGERYLSIYDQTATASK